MPKVIGLVAGGLDSLLIAKLLQKHNISHRLVHFDFGITHNKNITAGVRISKYFGLEDLVQNGFEIDKIDVSKEFFSSILQHHNFNDGTNICQTQKTFLLKKAKEYMETHGAELIISGEVINQRPMIQGQNVIARSDHEAHIENLIFRPLSAPFFQSSDKILQTYPVLKNMVHSFEGFDPDRCKLAQELGLSYTEINKSIRDNPEKALGEKVFDLFDKNFVNTTNLHRIGIHFQLSETCKLVIAQTPFESNYLKKFYDHLTQKGACFYTDDKSRFGFVHGSSITEQDEELAQKLFSFCVQEKNEAILLFDAEQSFLGKTKVKACSNETYQKYLLKINDLFCPIVK